MRRSLVNFFIRHQINSNTFLYNLTSPLHPVNLIFMHHILNFETFRLNSLHTIRIIQKWMKMGEKGPKMYLNLKNKIL